MGEENRHIPKIVLGRPQSLTEPTTHNLIILTTTILPPPIQMLKFVVPKSTSKSPKFPPMYPYYPQSYQMAPLIRILLPTIPMYSRATEHLHLLINSKLQHIKTFSRITKLQCQITRQTLPLESKLLVQIPAIINRFLPLSKAVMILLVPCFKKKGLRGNLSH